MRKIKGLRWYMIALVTLGTVLGYLTRNTVAAAAPTLMEELNISTQQYSYIIAAYSAAYTVMQPVAGYVLDVLGTKIGYAMFAVLWAVFCGATALAGSWGGLAIARGAVGAAEAAMIPAGLKASSEWFPAKERSIAVGYFNVGSSIGAMIAPPLVVWAIVMHSWQMAFIISGALSFIWAMAWLIFYKHPRDQKHLTDEERDYIINGQEAQHQVSTAKKMSVGQILRNRQFWGIALPRFLAEPAWGTFNAWIPLFMFKVYGFNLKEIAMFAWMPMLFADLGCILGGYLPPLFQRWFGVNLIVSRKMVVTLGAVLMIGPGINKVRERAYGNNKYNLKNLSYEDFRKAIQDERAYELAFEGHRRMDLVRWDIYYKTVKETSNAITEWFFDDNMAKNKAYNTAGRYTVFGKHELYPIPQRDMDLCEQFVQNPKWN